MSRIVSQFIASSILGVVIVACSADGAGTGTFPWSDQGTQVVDSHGNFTHVTAVDGHGCVEYLDFTGDCLKPSDACGTNAADVVLDAQGRLVDTLCYPTDATLTVDDLATAHGAIPKTHNNSVLVLDNLNDGADIVGDVTIDANNVVLYGDSANTAVIAGSLSLDGNNAFVRGVRIQGDVVVSKNNAVLAFCVIEGDLLITGNNTKLLGCDVLGSISIQGNNTQLYADHIAGTISPAGKNTDCKDDVTAHDLNADHTLQPNELGAPITCGK